MENQITSVKKFWAKNKDRILITSTVVLASVATIQQIGVRQHNDFLKEHGLFDEFYNPEEES